MIITALTLLICTHLSLISTARSPSSTIFHKKQIQSLKVEQLGEEKLMAKGNDYNVDPPPLSNPNVGAAPIVH